MAEDGDLDTGVIRRVHVQGGRKNWTSVSGLLCDRRINMQDCCKSINDVRGRDMCHEQEKKLNVAEIRMPRWMFRVTKLDRISKDLEGQRRWKKYTRTYTKVG